MKTFILTWLTITISLTTPAVAQVIVKYDRGQIKTDRVAGIQGTIDSTMYRITKQRLDKLKDAYGDIVLLMDTDGGSVDAGQLIIKSVDKIKRPGEKLVCVVTGRAVSMGFNILTHCDERYGIESAQYLFHDIYFETKDLVDDHEKLTPNTLYKLWVDLKKKNDYYSEKNAAALNMNRTEYDSISDADNVYWKTEDLVRKKYLKSKATVESK